MSISGKVTSIEYITIIHSVSTNPCFVNEPLIRGIGKGWGTKGHTSSNKGESATYDKASINSNFGTFVIRNYTHITLGLKNFATHLDIRGYSNLF